MAAPEPAADLSPRGWLGRLSRRLESAGGSFGGQLRSRVLRWQRLDDEFFDSLVECLVAADAGVALAERVVGELRRRTVRAGAQRPEQAVELLRQTLLATLLGRDRGLNLAGEPAVVVVVGVNGVGKTTTVAKLAHQLRSRGGAPLVAAADTYRAAASEQLQTWADRGDFQLVAHRQGADPGAVVFDSLAAARARGCSPVLVDTAGRLHTRQPLMAELAKIVRVIGRQLPGAPQEVLLVLDATTGSNALAQARSFQQGVGVTGLVVTKLDGSARAGYVLRLEEELDLAVKLVGVGEELDDLGPFEPAAYLAALFQGAAGERAPGTGGD
ncbi:MAG TPA: signal recognition particle-docking protein FtsY [Verrucomicrobiae bacterium]|nr:signal recognition particle-docking protein FtsY [Verrucomicrobiae bacterium]